jgi:hypothetical protein
MSSVLLHAATASQALTHGRNVLIYGEIKAIGLVEIVY